MLFDKNRNSKLDTAYQFIVVFILFALVLAVFIFSEQLFYRKVDSETLKDPHYWDKKLSGREHNEYLV